MSTRIPVPPSAADKLAPWYGTLPTEIPVVRGSFFGWLFGLFGQHAVTINGTVHWTKHAVPIHELRGIALLGHELFHVVQQRDMGWWPFIVRYVWHWRPKHIRRGWEHPYEVPAYERGREIREALQGSQ